MRPMTCWAKMRVPTRAGARPSLKTPPVTVSNAVLYETPEGCITTPFVKSYPAIAPFAKL